MAAKAKRIPSAVSFRFVPEATVDPSIFAASRGKVSLYHQALLELLKRPGSLMQVDSLTAKSGISAQARKHGIKVLFGEKDGKLYVKTLGKETPEDCVLRFLEQEGPQTLVGIEAAVCKAHPGAKLQEILDILSRNGKIQLRTAAGTNVKKWHLCLEATAAA